MAMTQRQFAAVAEFIAKLRTLGYDQATLDRVTEEAADICARENPRFKREKFYRVAGHGQH